MIIMILEISQSMKSIIIFIIGFLSGSGVIGVWLSSFFNKGLQRNQQEFEALGEIKDVFASDEMREAMTRLGNFRRDNPFTFPDIFSAMLKDGKLEANQIKRDSGKYFHHFENKVFGSFKKTTDEFIKRALYITQVELLLDVVDPLEKVKAKFLNTEYDENIAKECRRIFKDELEK